MRTGWLVYCVLAMVGAAIARTVETGRISSGVALFVFGFVIIIIAGEMVLSSKTKKGD